VPKARQVTLLVSGSFCAPGGVPVRGRPPPHHRRAVPRRSGAASPLLVWVAWSAILKAFGFDPSGVEFLAEKTRSAASPWWVSQEFAADRFERGRGQWARWATRVGSGDDGARRAIGRWLGDVGRFPAFPPPPLSVVVWEEEKQSLRQSLEAISHTGRKSFLAKVLRKIVEIRRLSRGGARGAEELGRVRRKSSAGRSRFLLFRFWRSPALLPGALSHL
jgi:hypothetical protein